jgi:hypothetical protein
METKTGNTLNVKQGQLGLTEDAKPKKPNEIPYPGKNPETVPTEEPEPGVWPRREPEIQPEREPLTIPPTAPPEIPAPPQNFTF